jgi:hypothetical protein
MTNSIRSFNVRAFILVFAAGYGAAACHRSDPAGRRESASHSSEPLPSPDVKGRLDIRVTEDGFVPAKAKVKVGAPVTLVVTRTVEKTCATEIVIADYGVNQPLPLNQSVEVTITPKKAGNIHFACAMNMITGELVAE